MNMCSSGRILPTYVVVEADLVVGSGRGLGLEDTLEALPAFQEEDVRQLRV